VIHYHGTPITPDKAAAEILTGRHAMVSFANPQQIGLVADACHSFTVDNGAFSFWKSKKAVDWAAFYAWLNVWRHHPGFDWALIPDVIDGTEEDNDALIEQWPFGVQGVPVWHMHESLDRLVQLVVDWPRVALGSSGEFAQVGTKDWWVRMADAMDAICDTEGRPATKLHGLRMLNPRVFGALPLSSADSTNIARNIGIDQHWTKGNYLPPTKGSRGIVMAHRIESKQSAAVWGGSPK
jgi:hypothetical protein